MTGNASRSRLFRHSGESRNPERRTMMRPHVRTAPGTKKPSTRGGLGIWRARHDYSLRSPLRGWRRWRSAILAASLARRTWLCPCRTFEPYRAQKGPPVEGLSCMARPARFERATAWFVARYSIQLSYGRLKVANYEGIGRDRQGGAAAERGIMSGYPCPPPCGPAFGRSKSLPAIWWLPLVAVTSLRSAVEPSCLSIEGSNTCILINRKGAPKTGAPFLFIWRRRLQGCRRYEPMDGRR